MKTIIRFVKPYLGRMSYGLVIKIIGTLVDLIIPFILKYMVDVVIPEKNLTKTIIYGVLMIVCSFIGIFGNVIANRMASYVARCVTKDIRHDLFCKVESLSFSQIDEVTIPSLVSRMTSDTYNIHQMVGMIQRMGVRAPILLIGGIVFTVILDPILTLVLFVTIPLITISTYVVTKAGIPLQTSVQKAIDEMVKSIRENASGARVIKALSKQDYEIGKFTKVNKEIFDCEIKAGVNIAKLNPLINLFLNVGLALVILVGAFRVDVNLSTPGDIISFTIYFSTILNAMLSITRIFMVLTRAQASANRIEYVLSLEETLLVEDIKPKESEYFIEFNNVNFSYNKKENNLENINFKLKKSESLGIIGSTGSGKTTLINLLMRFYDCDSGEILINGRNIKSIENTELKKMFGVVFQNDTLFFDTIFENISFGRDKSIEEVIKASKVSCAYEFISNLPEQFDTILNPKGTNLSGGQKQRILIARSLVNNPEILILDDASSALDYKTDRLLRDGIKREFSDTTQIIVTQRISSISHCDLILLIEDGKIASIGKHEDLLKTSEIYKEIYNSQMGGGLNE